MLEGRIFRDKESEQVYLSLLQQHFPSVETFEKYPDATLNLMFSSVCEKVLGKNFRKERVSKRKAKKINEEIIRRVHKKYGDWIFLRHFRIKRDLSISYHTNLHLTYKVRGMGALYGCEPHNIAGHTFFTSHALKRFEERGDQTFIEAFKKRFLEVTKDPATSYDILKILIRAASQQYGRLNKQCYLNTIIGFLILDDLGDAFIAKTFYSNDMNKDKIKWFQADIEKSNANSLADLLYSPATPIDEPSFLRYDSKDSLVDLFDPEESE